MLLSPLFSAALDVATTAGWSRDFSESMPQHAMTSSARGPLDVMLVVLGLVTVILVTGYAVRYLIHPGETSADHIKYRILEDGRGEWQ